MPICTLGLLAEHSRTEQRPSVIIATCATHGCPSLKERVATQSGRRGVRVALADRHQTCSQAPTVHTPAVTTPSLLSKPLPLPFFCAAHTTTVVIQSPPPTGSAPPATPTHHAAHTTSESPHQHPTCSAMPPMPPHHAAHTTTQSPHPHRTCSATLE
eukprot:366089-Chlamydomonas_euryale.AAC.7